MSALSFLIRLSCSAGWLPYLLLWTCHCFPFWPLGRSGKIRGTMEEVRRRESSLNTWIQQVHETGLEDTTWFFLERARRGNQEKMHWMSKKQVLGWVSWLDTQRNRWPACQGLYLDVPQGLIGRTFGRWSDYGANGWLALQRLGLEEMMDSWVYFLPQLGLRFLLLVYHTVSSSSPPHPSAMATCLGVSGLWTKNVSQNKSLLV